MILTLFGATGTVGKEIVKQALLDGHKVKAFGRNVFIAGLVEHENLTCIQGALFDANEVHAAIKGSDAVLSALGGQSDGTDQTRSLGMKNIVQQMEKAKVDRIIALGNMAILDDPETNDLILHGPEFPEKYKPVSTEHFKAWQHLKKSSLKWTFVCAPDLADHPATGKFSCTAEIAPNPNSLKINVGDLALFMLSELSENDYIQKRVGICN